MTASMGEEGAGAAVPGGAAGPAFSEDDLARLASCSAATISSQLHKRGVDETVMVGLSLNCPGRRMVGRARTVRYLPYRGDLAPARSSGLNAQKRAIESLRPGEVLVVDAREEAGAGTIGDLLALRAKVLGAAGVVTDGAIRDAEAIRDLGLPVFHAATNPAVLGRRHVPWETDVAVSCAGVLVEPGDVLVGDEDGVVVVPPGLVAEVARDGAEQERQERFIAERVATGDPIDGLFPLGPAWQERYEAWCRGETGPVGPEARAGDSRAGGGPKG
ncbi:MAG: hypothetical protein ACRDYY_02145 [Acidimicrobiales bacterium]